MGDELSDRLSELESQMKLLEQQIDHSKDMTARLLDDMARMLARHDRMMVGADGDSGLVMDVHNLKQEKVGDRLKSLETTITKWGGAVALATVVFPILIKMLWP